MLTHTKIIFTFKKKFTFEKRFTLRENLRIFVLDKWEQSYFIQFLIRFHGDILQLLQFQLFQKEKTIINNTS